MTARNSMSEIAKRCFSDSEYNAWHLLPPGEQVAAFFRLWTIKEAFVKAVGRGLAVGLERCEVDTEDYGRFLAIPEEYGDASAWKIVELACDAGFSAALVVPNLACRVGDRDLADIKKPL
jgi:4'-phosphopantetheinyl transferase